MSRPIAKVCHMTSVHEIWDERIFLKQCRSLARAGYAVVLVAPHDKDERIEGIQIRAIRRARNRGERMTTAVWAAFRKALRENAELYHFHDAELLPAGLLLRACGKRVVYDVHEDYAGSLLFRSWIPSLLRRLIATVFGLFEQSAAPFLDGIVAATPSIASKFSPKKTVTLRNYPILDEFKLEVPVPYASRPNSAGYIGGLSMVRGVHEMLSAVGLVHERFGVRLEIAGLFSPADLQEAAEANPGWKRVHFCGWTARSHVAGILGRVRMGLLLFHPVPNHIAAQPNKLFEYMSAGLPIIASDFPLWREIVAGAGCGLLVDPLDPAAIAQAMAWILDHADEAEAMGKKGQKAVRERYNWEAESVQLMEFYKKIL